MSKTKKEDTISSEMIKVNYSELKCGYVMPISNTNGYKDGHWNDVKELLDEITIQLGFKEPRIVSTGGASTTIHKKIVNNLFYDDLIICDVSSRNPNVMLELGMRIAFDKPVIIIKDDTTPYCFDSGTIEHIEYPQDMRYGLIETFKEELSSKIANTLVERLMHPKNSPILQSFGTFDLQEVHIPEMTEKDEFRADLDEIKALLFNVSKSNAKLVSNISPSHSGAYVDKIPHSLLPNPSQLEALLSKYNITVRSEGDYGITISTNSRLNLIDFKQHLRVIKDSKNT